MNQFIKEFNDLLNKYNITIDQAFKIFEINKIQIRRLIQCHEDDERMWQYHCGNEKNPCGCGSNCYHYEYDRIDNVIYGVCNACNTDVYIVKEEYMEEKLHTGKWLAKDV